MASTPPPPSPSALRVPAAPLHGAGYDQYSPYPTRYSTRLAKQRAVRGTETTPPPICPSSPSKARSSGSPKKCRKIQVDEETLSTPGASGRSKPNAAISKEGRRFNAQSAYDPFDMSASHNVPSSAAPHSRTAGSQALPTPAKTPSKKKVDNFSSASRTLFPAHTMSPKKPAPFSLGGFEAPASGKREIQIYTDSRDRIPKASQVATPFAARLQAPNDAGSSAPPRDGAEHDDLSGLGPPSSAVRRRRDARRTPDDQMTMIFRGKRVIQTFDADDEESEDDLGLFAARPDLLEGDDEMLNNIQTLSRDSIQPRQLFAQRKGSPPLCDIVDKGDDDAPTDDEGQAHDDLASPVATPTSLDLPQAPGATRITRSSARGPQVEETPTANIAPQTKRKRISPFDQWLRKKQKPETVPPPQVADKASDRAASPPGLSATRKTRSTRSS
ncbi:uncharacterized protein N7477_000187 [Penicillium maclennaniae]|uniref:uncharacterized protein n=1 Tax=Penicillium maclennaniae TaxID=1343394 RepID=UPI0025416F11|nr:uncharacterized protein N7477_000187 [Penicillium maclennaniae]KAJ5683842.1 hypothetical protein N7477_000187 [Penicillium maclennaniae]